MLTEGGATIARTAADIIEERGHVRGSFGTPRGPVCMLGALALASGASRPEEQVPIHDEVEVWLAGLSSRHNICTYNNTHTAEECVTKLREFADSR